MVFSKQEMRRRVREVHQRTTIVAVQKEGLFSPQRKRVSVVGLNCLTHQKVDFKRKAQFRELSWPTG